ncbi:MAG: hypothetical protein JXD18_01065 [Anaerolineae bacterium]|nr:hypothetical protein [Anaerolineae bacterium]
MEERRIETLVEECLQQVHGEGDVEAALQSYPHQAPELRPLLEMAVQTTHFYTDVPPPPGNLAAGRARMLEAAAQEKERARPVIMPVFKQRRVSRMKLVFATRLIGMMLAVLLGLTTVGGGVALAANDSLPGEALYPVKTAIEDLRIGLTSNPEARVALALQLVDERIAEIEALTQSDTPVPASVVARMDQHIQWAMGQAAQSSDDALPTLLDDIVQHTRIHIRDLDRIRASAPDQDQLRLESAQQLCVQAYGDAQAGLEDPLTFRLHHQGRVNMPEDVTPPEPQDGHGQGPGQQEPGGPGEGSDDAPQGPLGDPQQGDPQQGDPQQGDPQQGDPQQGEPQQGEPQQGDPQQGDPQQGDPQQSNGPGPGGNNPHITPTPTITPTLTPTSTSSLILTPAPPALGASLGQAQSRARNH